LNAVINKKVILFIVPLILYVSILSFVPLIEPDEARYSAIPSFMNMSGDYVTPHLKHVVYLEKPPLCYWVTALFFKIFGENEFSSRLFVALCMWGCILLVYRMGRHFYDEKAGLYCAAIFSTFFYSFIFGRINILDTPLTFFVCLAIWAGYRYVLSDYHHKRWLYLLYLASALSFLTKGLIGIVFPFGIIGLWLISCRKYIDVLRLFSPIGLCLFLLICSPWLILVQKANPDFFHFFFIHEHLQRYTTTTEHHQSLWYYLPIIILGTLPWLAFLFCRISRISQTYQTCLTSSIKRFLLLWLFLIFGFYSFSVSKLETYIEPIFLPIAVLFGALFRKDDEQYGQDEKGRFEQLWHQRWFATIYILTTFFYGLLIFLAAEFLTPYKSAYPVSQAIKIHLPEKERLYQYKIKLYGIDFYNKIRTPVVDDDFGELDFGVNKLSIEEKEQFFISPDKFYPLCRKKGGIYCIAHYKRLSELKEKIPNVDILWSNKNYYLLHLQM